MCCDGRVVIMATQPYKPHSGDKAPLMFDTSPRYLLQTAPAWPSYLAPCQPSPRRNHYSPLSFVCTTLHEVTHFSFITMRPNRLRWSILKRIRRDFQKAASRSRWRRTWQRCEEKLCHNLCESLSNLATAFLCEEQNITTSFYKPEHGRLINLSLF